MIKHEYGPHDNPYKNCPTALSSGTHWCALRRLMAFVSQVRRGGGTAMASRARPGGREKLAVLGSSGGVRAIGPDHRPAFAQPGGAHQSAAANLRPGQPPLSSIPHSGAVHGDV